jgi:hypothetical protein
VVVDHSAPESNDLLAEFLAGRQDIGCDVGAKRLQSDRVAMSDRI